MASLAVFDLSPLFRAGLAALASTMGFDPVEQAADLDDLIRRDDDAMRPDLMLIGLPQDLADLPALMEGIRVWAPDTRVVVIAPSLDATALGACFAAGASGYLIESISREGLKHSLGLVNAGENVFPSELASALSSARFRSRGPAEIRRELRELHATDREVDILRCLANGESNNVIAKRLGISETAVSADIRHILRKLRVSNRTQAALWAVAKGLAAPFADQLGPTDDSPERNGVVRLN
jgi:two-component system, NarL family, nitrate/nitrite response regulator NarL